MSTKNFVSYGDAETLFSGVGNKITNLKDWTDADTKSVTGNPITISDAAAVKAKALSMTIEPVQDLHGFDHPWVGGAYKNKAYVNINSGETALTEIKDNDNNVIGVNADVDAAVGVVTVKMATVSIENGKTYTLSGSPNDKSNSTYRLDVRTQAQGQLYNNWNEIDNPTITATEDVTLDIYLRIAANYAVNNLVFHPQIEEGSTPTTFAPYTNICPITGSTEASVQRDGKNLLESGNSETVSGILYTKNADGSFTVSGTRNGAMSKNLGYANVTSAMGIVNVSVSGTYQNVQLYTIRLKDANGTDITTKSSFGNIDLSAYPTVAKIGIEFKGTVDGAVASGTLYPMVAIGEETIPFEPYQGKTYTIALGDTIYGGEVDFDTGKVRVTQTKRTYTGDVSESWTVSSANSWHQFLISDLSIKSSNIKSNLFISMPIADRGSKTGIIAYDDASIRVTLLDSQLLIESVEDWRTWLSNNNLEVSLDLATPIELTLTPQQIQLLKGTNTITGNGSSISLTYQQDNLVGEVMEQVEPQIDDLQEQVNELASDLDEQATNHIVLSIPANTYNTREAALTAMYTTYNALSSDEKRRAYIIWGDTVYRNGYMPNGYFSAIFPRWDDGSSAWISQIIIIDLEHANMLSSLLGASGTTTTNLKANAQDVDVSLCY